MVGLVFLLVSLFASWEIALSLVDSAMMKDEENTGVRPKWCFHHVKAC